MFRQLLMYVNQHCIKQEFVILNVQSFFEIRTLYVLFL